MYKKTLMEVVRRTYPVTGINRARSTSDIRGRGTIARPEPNVDIRVCAFHGVPEYTNFDQQLKRNEQDDEDLPTTSVAVERGSVWIGRWISNTTARIRINKWIAVSRQGSPIGEKLGKRPLCGKISESYPVWDLEDGTVHPALVCRVIWLGVWSFTPSTMSTFFSSRKTL